MSFTWSTRLAAGDAQWLRLFVVIQGIPDVFQTSHVELPTTFFSAARPRRRILGNIRQGGAELDLNRRRMIGGSLRFELHEDEVGSLAALFATRRERTTFIASNATEVATTIVVKNNAAFGTTGTLYCGGETITWTGKSGGTQLTGCTRGAYGSRPRSHFGTSEDGEAVYLAPPTWFGRRVYLNAYFENDVGEPLSTTWQQVGTFSIEGQPTFSAGGTWTIECSELTDEIGKKVIGAGLKEEKLDEDAVIAINQVYRLPTWALNKFKVYGGGQPMFARLVGTGHTEGEVVVAQVTNVTTRLVIDDASLPTLWDWPVGAIGNLTILADTPGQCVAWALASRLGNGDNGAFDVLPGREHTSTSENEWFIGAGIEQGEVDFDSLGLISDQAQWRYVIDDEHPLEEMLSDFTFATNSFWKTDRLGALTFAPLNPEANPIFTFDDTNILADAPPTVAVDESLIHPRVQFHCNYDMGSKTYGLILEFTDGELARLYPQITELFVVKSRTVYVRPPRAPNIPPSPISFPMGPLAPNELPMLDLQNKVRQAFQPHKQRPLATVTIRSDISALDVELGDVVQVTADVPDLAGASSLVSRRAFVIGKQPRWEDGTIDWKLSLLPDNAVRVAPAAVVQSAAGAVLTLRANSTTYPHASGANPGDMFAVNQSVRVWDVSAATYDTRSIASVGTGTITLSSAPSFVVQNDVDFVTLGDMISPEYGPSANGYTDHDFAYSIPDDENDGTVVRITRLI